MGKVRKRKRMQYFNLDDIAEDLYKKFPELTKASVKRIASSALKEIAKRAETGKPISINGRTMLKNEGFDFYALYMPADAPIIFGKIYKYDNRGKRKRKE